MTAKETFGFVGGGAMAESLIRGFLQNGLAQPTQVWVSDISTDRLSYLANTYKVATTTDNAAVAAQSSVVLLTIKPNIVLKALDTIAAVLAPDTLVISVAAGVPLAKIEAILMDNPIIRVMPNTPVAVGAGMSAVSLGSKAQDHHGRLVAELFAAVGKSVIVEEGLLDAVTGLSGSGPGYAFVLIDALADAGVRVGLPRKMAITLAAQTLLGSAKMVLETGEHPAALRDGVTSPGGTTIAGIHVLEQQGVRAALSDAVMAACEKSREMGKTK